MNETTGVHRGSPAQTKIALFRALFRGREDVYPRRFESLRTGKSGYTPGVRQRMAARCVRETENQVRRLSQSAIPAGHRRRDPLAPDRCG